MFIVSFLLVIAFHFFSKYFSQLFAKMKYFIFSNTTMSSKDLISKEDVN